MAWFCLVSARYPQMALQSAAHSGQPLTLQTLDIANPLQHWQLQLHSALQVWGVALVNPATDLTVSYSGYLQALLMSSYVSDDIVQPAWYATATAETRVFRIALSSNTHIVWTERAGQFQPGATIHSCDIVMTADNALWTIRHLT